MKEYAKKPENTSRTIQSNPRASRQASAKEILQTYKNRMLGEPVQRQSIDEEESSHTEDPQAIFFMKQPHEGKLAAFCGYYALVHYLGHELNLDDFTNDVYKQYRAMGMDNDIDIEECISQYGTGMEGIAVNGYNFTESSNSDDGIENGRFMAATDRYGGHWITYIKDDSGTWWEYDSWKNNPEKIGDENQLRDQLNSMTITNVYYKNK